MATLSWDGDNYSSTKINTKDGVVAINPAFMAYDLWEALYKAKTMDVSDDVAHLLIQRSAPRPESFYDHMADENEAYTEGDYSEAMLYNRSDASDILAELIDHER